MEAISVHFCENKLLYKSGTMISMNWSLGRVSCLENGSYNIYSSIRKNIDHRAVGVLKRVETNESWRKYFYDSMKINKTTNDKHLPTSIVYQIFSLNPTPNFSFLLMYSAVFIEAQWTSPKLFTS